LLEGARQGAKAEGLLVFEEAGQALIHRFEMFDSGMKAFHLLPKLVSLGAGRFQFNLAGRAGLSAPVVVNVPGNGCLRNGFLRDFPNAVDF